MCWSRIIITIFSNQQIGDQNRKFNNFGKINCLQMVNVFKIEDGGFYKVCVLFSSSEVL